MRLVMTLLVRDEDDIVDANIRYHLAQGVDHVIATDNGSTDGTLDILRRHERAGHLTLLQEPSTTFAQSAWVTRMARLAATQERADWVIDNDADEFWQPVRGTLKDALASVPPSVGVVRFPRWNLPSRVSVAGPWWDTMVARERTSLNALGMPLPPKVAHRAHPDVEVAAGNHAARVPGLPDHLDSPAVEILHFPMRDPERLRSRIAAASRAVAQDPSTDAGGTWRRLIVLGEAGLLDAWFRRQALDDDALHAGLVDGRLVIDRRIQRAIHALGADRVSRGSR